jgi:hypothetical protein
VVPFTREFLRHLLLFCSHAVTGSKLCHLVPLFKHVHSHAGYLWRIPQVECRQVMPDDPNGQTARNNTTAAVCCELKTGGVPCDLCGCEVLLVDRGEYQVTAGHFARTSFLAYFLSQAHKVFIPLQVHRRPEVLCGGSGLFSERADPAHGDDKGAGLQGRRSNPRENLAGFELCGARCRVRYCAGGWISDPNFVPRCR